MLSSSPRTRMQAFEQFFWEWWKIGMFVLGSFFIYEQAAKQIRLESQTFKFRLLELNKEKEKTLLKKEILSQQVNSQSDPYWIEITLMKGLGLVPEGSTKLFFEGTNTSPIIQE